MFGKPEWFQKKSVGWGLRPVLWKGWLYAMLWAGVICIPFIALLANTKVVESLIWVVVMIFALLWDVQHVMREIDAPVEATEVQDAAIDDAIEAEAVEDDVLIIDDDTQPDPAYFATRSYDLHVRG